VRQRDHMRFRLTWVGVALAASFAIGAVILESGDELPQNVTILARLLITPWYAGILGLSMARVAAIPDIPIPWYVPHAFLLMLFVLCDLLWTRLSRRRASSPDKDAVATTDRQPGGA
jgi:hypothetical protein